ncbi:MAG: bifunctional adenosylcobinamide kinase/adenosylcobinamide-phosphate guanylyltransferase [Proteobacteria bacterium]|nr:bifunctional adenosylcobinamide kinase/adenosylcobinamide-phosphate guanylyltransferase [Pseudomonadota bacterium]MBU1420508.1 bifunctional adenosylcobinamide kinase/adenosylcobinamide-phosphate guanylyltransferase [Pseudomonadota bacterium]MBU1456071.1 bifunctional adenosylcobinamide kinase/adenosylcobinamide-phosphate guanylyltransferase [Pseudomonadota bacterium]
MRRLILVTGGARSGKSDYALSRAQALPGPHVFLATCPVIDSEMDDRIARHKADRENGIWQTIEEEIELAATISSLKSGSVCLVDCLTLWVNNLMYHAEKANISFGEDEMRARCEALVRTAAEYQGTLICVSNEVGMGVVPDNASARLYRDLVGRCNRMLAAAANEVILVSCGLPLFLKECVTDQP